MRLRVFAGVIALTGSLFAADPGLLSLAMPDGQVIAGVNFEQIMLSPFGQYLASQTAEMTNNAGLPKLIETAGFDPRRDLKEILASAKLFPNADQAILLARGAFDVPKILEAARASGATVDSYKGVSYIQMSKHAAMAFPDSTIVISGDPASVQGAVDRITAPAPIPSALAVQVNQLSSSEDVWFVETIPLSQLKPQGPQTPDAAQKAFALLGQIQQASGGIKFGANAMVDLQAILPTTQQATGMAALMKSFAGASDMFVHDHYAPAATLLKGLNATADGTVVKLSLTIPEQQIEQMMQMQKSQSTQAQHSNPPQPKVQADAQTDVKRIRVGSEVQKAKLVQHTEPVYPPLALQARISGVVHLNAVIGKDGTVKKLTLASGHPLLVQAAMEAVKQSVYEPTLSNGEPVEVVTQIDVNFTLGQ